MNDIRAKFEEIWPVPKRIYWSESRGEYMPQDEELEYLVNTAIEWDSRLDTFTRCQETTALYADLVDDLISALEHHFPECNESVNKQISGNLIYRAKHFMEQKK